MNLEKYYYVTGKSSLCIFVAKTKNGIIAESLNDKSRFPVIEKKAICINELGVLCEEEDIPVKKVFDLIYKKEAGGLCIDSKASDSDIINYFKEIIPNYKKNEVFHYHFRRISSWYNQLHSLDLLIPEEEEEKKEEDIKEDTKDSN